MNTNPIGRGFTTSEFSVTIGGVAASLLVMAGVINADQLGNVSQLIATAVTGIVALVSIWGIVAQYVHGRNQIKQTMLSQGFNPTQTIPQAPMTP